MLKRFAIVYLLFWLAVGIIYRHLAPPILGIDDAYIFLVYAKNWLSGAGLVYYPGGEHVEGFSSFLWLMMITPCLAIFPQPQLALLFINVTLVSLTLTYLWYFVDNGAAFRLRGWLLLIWVFSSPSFILWVSLTLMDTALWMSLLTFATLFCLTNSPYLTAIIPLMLLARPEGMGWALIFMALQSLISYTTDKTVDRTKQQFKKSFLSYSITLTLLITWRLVYFGYPLPNTYYAKMSPDFIYNLTKGFIYFAAFLQDNLILVVICLPAVVAGVILNLPRLQYSLIFSDGLFDPNLLRFVVVSLIVLTAFFLPIWTGGDHFRLFRFYQVTWPLFILPALSFLDVTRPKLKKITQYGLVLLFFLLSWGTPVVNWYNHEYTVMKLEFLFAHEGSKTGETLDLLLKDNLPSLGVVVAGGVAFTYNGTLIDLMGLNNVAMAHAPGERKGMKNHAAFNTDVFFTQKPDLMLPIILTPTQTLSMKDYSFYNEVLKGLLVQPQFRQSYRLVVLSQGQIRVGTFAQLSYLATLDPQKFRITSANLTPPKIKGKPH